MSPLDAVWHLLNFFAPAIFLGLVSALAAKMVWRRDLHRVAWRQLLTWAVLPPAAVAVLGLVLSSRDGRMATYAAMAAACALGLWWRCFLRRP